MSRTLSIPARPEPLPIEPARTAVLVVDMQNAFASKGGYLDLFGVDVSGAPAVIARTREVLVASRQAGMTVVFLQMGWTRISATRAARIPPTGTRPTRSA